MGSHNQNQKWTSLLVGRQERGSEPETLGIDTLLCEVPRFVDITFVAAEGAEDFLREKKLAFLGIKSELSIEDLSQTPRYDISVIYGVFYWGLD